MSKPTANGGPGAQDSSYLQNIAQRNHPSLVLHTSLEPALHRLPLTVIAKNLVPPSSLAEAPASSALSIRDIYRQDNGRPLPTVMNPLALGMGHSGHAINPQQYNLSDRDREILSKVQNGELRLGKKGRLIAAGSESREEDRSP